MNTGGFELGFYGGIVFLFLVGVVAHFPWPGVMRKLRLGAWWVAISQFAPIIQLMAGTAGFMSTSLLFGHIQNAWRFRGIRERLLDELQMFCCVLITGVILLGLSLLLGVLIEERRRRTSDARLAS